MTTTNWIWRKSLTRTKPVTIPIRCSIWPPNFAMLSLQGKLQNAPSDSYWATRYLTYIYSTHSLPSDVLCFNLTRYLVFLYPPPTSSLLSPIPCLNSHWTHQLHQVIDDEKCDCHCASRTLFLLCMDVCIAAQNQNTTVSGLLQDLACSLVHRHFDLRYLLSFRRQMWTISNRSRLFSSPSQVRWESVCVG